MTRRNFMGCARKVLLDNAACDTSGCCRRFGFAGDAPWNPLYHPCYYGLIP